MPASPFSFASQHYLLVFAASLHKSEVLYVTKLLLFPPGTQVNQLQLIFVMLNLKELGAVEGNLASDLLIRSWSRAVEACGI